MRKKNGEEYEPSSRRAFIQSIDRHLRKNNYGFSVLNDKEFHEVQDILKKKQKQLKSIGKGNRPNAADPLSDEDIDTFYSRKVLGIHSPRALLNTLWMNNCTFFGMRPGKEQRDLRVARTISHSFTSLTREILFLPLEHKIHIFSPPCNILYL